MTESKAVRNNPYKPQYVATPDMEAITAIDNSTYLIQEGCCWYAENVYPILTGTTVDLVLDASGMTKLLRSFPTSWATSSGPVTITLGTCTSYTGGTEITPINRKAGANSREVEMYLGATITGGVFPPYPTILVGSASTQQNSGGGITKGSLPIILDNNTIYVFRITNNSGDDISLYSDIIWFEIPVS